ncbi:Translocon-associated protein subunit delta-like [Oopsacas minuta]|uniref:Translocon-associated protein subunit delta n=1 Tax=Oopsacas minuta TaxID=111878 RepID=A0AAV7JD06_9METZ|nr:Translocon-associated protein subunit delta-like [Oopsacas minuta]
MAKGLEKYQITWVNEHSVATPGKYEIQIYDEESFTLLRKAERSGSEETTNPIFVLKINHPGARSPKPSIPIETFFILALIALIWFAYINKSRLVE